MISNILDVDDVFVRRGLNDKYKVDMLLTLVVAVYVGSGGGGSRACLAVRYELEKGLRAVYICEQ